MCEQGGAPIDEEERHTYADKDKEWMCGEVESVSEITGEWD